MPRGIGIRRGRVRRRRLCIFIVMCRVWGIVGGIGIGIEIGKETETETGSEREEGKGVDSVHEIFRNDY